MDRPIDQREPVDRKQAASLANACVEQLKRVPNDIGTREKLARIFTEQLERADLGLEQLRLLLDLPEQPESKRAEWLSLTAAWELRYARNVVEGKRILERIINEFPTSPQAFAARRRLVLMEAEAARRAQGTAPST